MVIGRWVVFGLLSVMLGGCAALGGRDLRDYPGWYTLQVAYFDQRYEGEGGHRAAAERMASELREEEVESYFYHGPAHSIVTVGLFDEDDFVTSGAGDRQQIRFYGERIRSYQKQFPLLMVNGQPVMSEDRLGRRGQRGSSIVRVPEQ